MRSAIGYGASEWHHHISKSRAKTLGDIQTECLRKVIGAFKATAATTLETEAYVSPLDAWLNKRVAASEERLQQPRIASLIQARCENAARWILTRPTRRRRPKGPDAPDRKRWLDEWLAGDSTHKAEERDWLHKWQQSQTSRQNQTSRAPAATKKPPDKHVLKLHKGLHKAESSILVQARTGKIGLRDFLFKRRVLGFDSLRCDCG